MKPGRKRGIRWDGDRVRALRKHLKMTQQELANELGTRQQTISEWETGAYSPRGTSSTVLNMVAERASFRYRSRRAREVSKGDRSSAG